MTNLVNQDIANLCKFILSLGQVFCHPITNFEVLAIASKITFLSQTKCLIA